MQVCAVDVGYGNTKYTKFGNQPGIIEYRHFPSVAPMHTGIDVGGDALSKKNVMRIKAWCVFRSVQRT